MLVEEELDRETSAILDEQNLLNSSLGIADDTELSITQSSAIDTILGLKRSMLQEEDDLLNSTVNSKLNLDHNTKDGIRHASSKKRRIADGDEYAPHPSFLPSRLTIDSLLADIATESQEDSRLLNLFAERGRG